MTPHPNLTAALCAFHKAAPSVTKTRKGQKGHLMFQYADLGDILDGIRAALVAAELAVIQTTEPLDAGGVALVTTLAHTSGEAVRSLLPIPSDPGNDVREFGRDLTLLRRYAVCAILGIAADREEEGQEPSRDRAGARPPHNDRPPANRPAPRATTPPGAAERERLAALEAACEGRDYGLAEVEQWAAGFFKKPHLVELTAGECRRAERAVTAGEVEQWIEKQRAGEAVG